MCSWLGGNTVTISLACNVCPEKVEKRGGYCLYWSFYWLSVYGLYYRRRDIKTATMSSKRAKGKNTKKRPQRATSNVFAMFDQSQIQEFKEAFNMIDQNRDGFIDKEDLHDMLASLGDCCQIHTN